MLRILVVYDDPEKLRRVINWLAGVPGCSNEDIDSAHDVNDARRLLREHAYDLMVLDIALPDRPNDFPSPDGGIKLLEEVLERDIYTKPREVVGLTAFADVLESAGRRFAEDLWLVIHYDPTADIWVEQLQRKVKYICLAKKFGTTPEFHSHLCIVTALSSPELTAIRDIPWNWEQHEERNDPTIYQKGCFTKAGESRQVYAASTDRMGMPAAALLAEKMITTFRPHYLAMVGMLAGVPGRCSLGDIIVADPSWDWGSGKYLINNGNREFAPAPYQIGLNSFLRSKFALLSNTQAALDGIRNGWPGEPPATALRMHIGPVASGAAVLSDPEIRTFVMEQHRKLLAIEMESYGVMLAAQESTLPLPKAFAIKSVADYGDSEKDDRHQRYACYTSATALRVFIERFL